MPMILEKQWKLRKWVYLRPTLHSQKPAQTSISQNAQKLMESMVSHLKSLVSSVKKTELQLYHKDVVPPTKDWKALHQWDNHFSLIFITPPESTNKELINLLYNDVKNFYFELQQSSKVCFFLTMIQNLYLHVIITLVVFLHISRHYNHVGTNK